MSTPPSPREPSTRAQETDNAAVGDPRYPRHTVGSTLVSVVVGVVIGLVAVAGLATFTADNSGSNNHAVNNDDALLGNVDYGSR